MNVYSIGAESTGSNETIYQLPEIYNNGTWAFENGSGLTGNIIAQNFQADATPSHGSGYLELNGGLGAGISLYPYSAGSGTSYSLYFPQNQGTGVLNNDGSGNLSWISLPCSLYSGTFGCPGLYVLAQGTATSGENYSSYSVDYQGSYWNGSSSAGDAWYWQDVIGTGSNPTSTFTLAHEGTSGAASVDIDYPTTLGTVSTQKEINKQPRIDVTHPDFGSGCANAADPTGTLDSTCAIQNAITYQESLYTASGGMVDPALYFPAGLYKISSELVIPATVPILGDGENASYIEQTGTYADGIKILARDYTPPGYLSAGGIRDITIEGQGSSTWGTLLDIVTGTGYVIDNIRLYNTAGRGLQNMQERTKIHDLEIDSVRWPAVFPYANEVHWDGVQINNPGATQDGHCYDADCSNSYLPPVAAPSGLTLASASASGSVVTFTITGATSAVWSAGQSVQIAGPWSLSGWQAVYPISTVSYASGTITLTAPAYWGQSGSGSVTGATILTAWKPPDHAAVTLLNAQNFLLTDGSIKPLIYATGFQEYICDGCQVSKIYFEASNSASSPPAISVSATAGGSPYVMQISGLTSTGTTTTVPWNQGIWGISWYNDASDVGSAQCDWVRIYPPDAFYGSTTGSAYQSGVQQGQYENACADFTPVSTTGGVTVTLVNRNMSGSTAPANTAWVNNSLMVFAPTNENYADGFQFIRNHTNADTAQAQPGFYTDCNDTAPGRVCAEAVVGYEPNGINIPPPAQSGNIPEGATFRDDSFSAIGSSELTGAGSIKNPSNANILLDNATAGPYTSGELNPVLSGVNPTAPFDNAIYSINYGPSGTVWNWINPNTGTQSYTLPSAGNPEFYYWDASNGMAASANGLFSSTGSMDFVEKLSDHDVTNIDSTVSSLNGWEYGNHACFYEQPATSTSHSLSRWCLWGGPSYSSKMEYDLWNGSAWVSSWNITGSVFSLLNGGLYGYVSGGSFNLSLNGGHDYTRHTIVTCSLTPVAVAANTCAAQTLTCNGIAAGDHVINRDVVPSFSAGLALDGVLVTGANTISTNWCNNTASSITPPSGTYTFDVEQ